MALDSQEKLRKLRLGIGYDTPAISLYDLISILSYYRSTVVVPTCFLHSLPMYFRGGGRAPRGSEVRFEPFFVMGFESLKKSKDFLYVKVTYTLTPLLILANKTIPPGMRNSGARLENHESTMAEFPLLRASSVVGTKL